MRRTLVLAAALVVLWSVVSQANHLLTPLRVYLFTGGLFVAYAALTQPLRPGLAASILGGLVCDAQAPAGLFGAHTLLFAAAHLGIFQVRDRIPRDDTASRVVVALLANFALFLLLSFGQIRHSPAPAAAWPRLLADLLCSQVFLALISPWFFALQSRALVLTGVNREALS